MSTLLRDPNAPPDPAEVRPIASTQYPPEAGPNPVSPGDPPPGSPAHPDEWPGAGDKPVEPPVGEAPPIEPPVELPPPDIETPPPAKKK